LENPEINIKKKPEGRNTPEQTQTRRNSELEDGHTEVPTMYHPETEIQIVSLDRSTDQPRGWTGPCSWL
jgi:hypothetical protein